ncbi:MAG: ABC transporter substrate-binding protein [Oscillospiraceae bacterium]|nr:ABC transporter substrate-binding protein [Oscillospiraceae bacterium]
MKKAMTLFFALVLALGLTACGAGAPNETPAEPTEMNVYVLAGPTGIGALPLWAKADGGEELQNVYHVTMTGANDEIVAAVSGGAADIACVATNMAATLYNKTEGGVKVLAVNTLGVLSVLTNGTDVSTVADLQGKTVYSPGQGANPEYILRYVLQGNGLDPESDVEIRFVGEGSELLGVWQTEPDAVILAPQPVATTLQMQYEGAKTALDMTEEWDKVSGGESTLMMGCVIVRTAFLEEHPAAVEGFLEDYAASIETARNDVEGTAALCQTYGIIPKAALAAKAIPYCGLTYVSGTQMREQLSGYLSVMFDANPKSVGGKLPGDDFYYGA